jgi:uncharacterized SAM-binding protein YcdF (DUF218 family)
MNRLLRALGLLVLILFVTCAYTSLPNVLSRAFAVAQDLRPAGAIVVLSFGESGAEELSALSLRRAVRGMELFRAGLAPLLVFIGPGGDSVQRTEAKLRSDLAQTLGIPAEAILRVEGAWSTREEARLVSSALHPRGIRRILLVTDAQHMARARALFARVGFEVFPAPVGRSTGNGGSPGSRLELTREVLLEIVARLYYRAAGYL